MESLPQPEKKINYPIAHDDTGGCLFLYGKTEKPAGEDDKMKVILCCPGFPDDHAPFMPIASRLAKEQNCVVGVMCLPGFDDRPERPWSNHCKDGYTVDEMVAAFKEGSKTLLNEVTKAVPREQIDYTVMIHDWGVVMGMLAVNLAVEEEEVTKPAVSLVPNQVILLDVGLAFHRQDKESKALAPTKESKPMRDVVSTTSYQLSLALLFALHRYVSSSFGLAIFGIAAFFLKLTGLYPTRDIDSNMFEKRDINKFRFAYLCYPYVSLMKAVFGGKPYFTSLTLPVLKNMPILFMYGMDKNLYFHENRLVDCLKAIESGGGRSRCVAVKNGGHWFYLQQPEIFYQEVCKFLELGQQN